MRAVICSEDHQMPVDVLVRMARVLGACNSSRSRQRSKVTGSIMVPAVKPANTMILAHQSRYKVHWSVGWLTLESGLGIEFGSGVISVPTDSMAWIIQGCVIFNEDVVRLSEPHVLENLELVIDHVLTNVFSADQCLGAWN
ncbi:hypothetical protein L1987_42246 [Smallanthus sonchifolius]|uniref:Uncharacterized protein n=1 Tax=Smallanthus sonchifolius TaxID=185202 RepID=A0ACB9GXE1_9ASTR|nr:hypothetical protein L1987_42246 [Smallanthus sonchifolius]